MPPSQAADISSIRYPRKLHEDPLFNHKLHNPILRPSAQMAGPLEDLPYTLRHQADPRVHQ